MKRMETTKNVPVKSSEFVTYMRVGSPAQIGKVMAYARCAAQDKDGQELRRRTAETLAVAAAHGLKLEAEDVIAEYGSGADIAGRPGLTALLKEVESGKVRALVVTSLDRLGRGFASASRVADALRTHGVTVVTKDNVFHLDQDGDAAWWGWCESGRRPLADRGSRVARMRHR